MRPNDRPSAPCPNGFEDSRIAALLIDPGDPEADAHMLRCPVCAERYLDHVVIRDTVRQILAEIARESAGRPARSSWTLLFRRFPLAAAILIGLVGVAAATAILLPWSAILDTGWRPADTVEDRERMRRIDYRAAGLPPGARVVGSSKFLESRDAIGTVLAVHIDASQRMDIAAFGQGGDVAWTARRLWPEWEELLGKAPIDMHRIESIVSRRDASAVEERLCFLVAHMQVGACLIVDPVTGRLEGRYFHPGWLGSGALQFGGVHVLPGSPGPRRRLLVLGEHGYGTSPSPCLSVIECDGTRVQHVELPTFGSSGREGAPFGGAWVDWTPGSAELQVINSDGLVFKIPLAGGRLAVADASVRAGDLTRTNFDRARGREGAYDAWVAQQGGREAAMRTLAAAIRETEFELLSGWSDR